MSIGSIGGTYGLSGSGMDIDSIVKSLMTSQQAKADALVQKKTVLQWQKSAYNTVYDDINTFRTAVFNFKLQSTLSPNKVSSSNTSVATVTASADAVDVNHSLVVTQLASGVNLTSSAAISATQPPTLGNLATQLGMPTTSFNITLSNGSATSLPISIDPQNDTINSVVSKINNAGINVKVYYDSTLDRLFMYSANTGSTAGISFDGSSAEGLNFVLDKLKLPGLATLSDATTSSISIGTVDPTQTLSSQFPGLPANFTLKLTNPKANGGAVQTIAVNTTGTLNDLMGAINASGSATASFDQITGKFTITPTGIGGTLDFTGSGGDGLSFLSSSLKLSVSTHNGKDAIFNIDGASDLTQPSNNFTLSGVTYNLTGVSATPTTISVTNDVDKAVASIQSLVDSYNKILADLNGKGSETRYKDFPPLTDAQKSVMKESDITAWETKAKSGMLHNDSTLASLVNAMRSAFSNPVTGINPTIVSGIPITYNSGSSIGITTGNYTEGGKLALNTDKLRTALQANPDVLNQLFGAAGTTTTSGGKTITDTNSQGIAGRLYNGIKTTMDQLAQTAGTTAGAQYDTNSNFAKRMTAYNLQIRNTADRFDTMEKAYYKKFNAMEVALKQLNSQSSWLSSQLSPSNG